MSSVVGRRSKSTRPCVEADRLVCDGGERPRLLLAEDSETARALMSTLLEKMGCSVDAVEDGNEALARARDNIYDAILMDLEMPVLDGLSAALEIRQLEGRAAQTPIIALSALLADISSRPILAAAFNAAIVKPARRADLHRVLGPIINIDRTDADTPSPAATNIDDTPPEPLDRTRLGEILHGLRPSHQRALQIMAADELTRLAGELCAAVPTGTHSEINYLAHKIRGTAANFAAVHLAETAAGLEADCVAERPTDLADRSATIARAAADVIAALKSPRRAVQPLKAKRSG